jgi:transketolase
MRGQLVKTVEQQLAIDERLVLLLGDIGVFGFRNAFNNFPNRVFNIGILEPTTMSLASGLAKSELIPIIHTIAPFLVERSYEQIKIDFGYQRVGGNFISVGASYDYAALGCTHHCPGDVGALMNIPGIEIVVPGTGAEFDTIFKQAYANGQPTYYRLSERENPSSQEVQFGKANVVQVGSLATIVVVGPALQHVLPAVEGLDVGVVYYSTVAPFDYKTLSDTVAPSGKVLLVEPFYKGTLSHEVSKAVYPKSVAINTVGVPRQFLTNYGSAADHDDFIGLNARNIRAQLEALIDG